MELFTIQCSLSLRERLLQSVFRCGESIEMDEENRYVLRYYVPFVLNGFGWRAGRCPCPSPDFRHPPAPHIIRSPSLSDVIVIKT